MPAVDIELTNACNTVCVFCPRDKMPKKGFMDVRTFEQAVARVQELAEAPEMKFCGTGEPLLHHQAARFVEYLAVREMPPTVSTNAWLLTEDMSRALLDAGLKRICFSVSGIFEGYEKIHRLSFDVVRGNIERFLDMARGLCEAKLSIVRCDENRNEIESIKAFWKSLGIEKMVVFNYVNRSGKLDQGRDFAKDPKWIREANDILQMWLNYCESWRRAIQMRKLHAYLIVTN